MTDKTFILGVGCQKGGTTWLHSQLIKHPAIDMGFTKEYHIFDYLYLKELPLEKRVNPLTAVINSKKANISESKKLKAMKIIAFYRDTKNYFEYFDSLLSKSNKTRIVGDITPAYSGLTKDVFKHIKDQLQDRGIKVKVIFLMRDPIERIWSSVRMNRRNRLKKEPQFVFQKSEEQTILSVYQSKACERRTRYEKTISNIESVFDSQNIFYGFYEKLFTTESIRDIEDFLEISNFNVDFNEQVNVSKKKFTSLKPKIAKGIFEYYKNTYLFCDSKFNTSEIWEGYKHF